MKKTFLLIGLASLAFSTMAQDNLLANLEVNTLGPAKVWTDETGDKSFTFDVKSLKLITNDPANTSDVFLYPQAGGISDLKKNQNEVGIQGFYIDLGSSHSIGTVTTTWEGAAADTYEIYVTDETPTLSILEGEPDYYVEGLKQYTSHTAVLEKSPKGRYLVFQPLVATNYGWGVKIHSISATAPVDDILTSFKVSPSIILEGQETEVSFKALNQLGVDITDKISISCEAEGNFNYSDGKLTINSGKSATFTAKLDDTELNAVAYVALCPQTPTVADIKTPIFTNGVTGDNSSVEFSTGYNGGAVNKGTIEFSDGTIAQQFNDARCIFFSNKVTTGDWNGNIFPFELGYRTLHLEVFGGSDSEFTIEFEGVENLEGGHTYKYNLKPGEWTAVDVDIEGATKLNNLSIRFTEENMSDILLANIYFTGVFDEEDDLAPEFEGEITAVPTENSVELTFKATDDKSESITYTIILNEQTYITSGKSGEEVNYTINNLISGTDYELTITASDGKNISELKTITFKTEGLAPAVATSIELTTADPTDIIVGESVKFTANVIDQYGEEMKNLTAILEGEGIEDGIFTAYAPGVYTIIARYEQIESTPILVNVCGSEENLIYPVYFKTYFGDEEIENPQFPFAGVEKKSIQEWKPEDMKKGFVIAFLDEEGVSRSADLDLILIHWEASCPKDYIVELEDLIGNKQTVNFNDKELQMGQHPVDRIAAEKTSVASYGKSRMNQAQTASNLTDIHKITITPTSMPEEAINGGWSTKLYGLTLYGTAGDGLVTNVAEIPAIEKASAQYYTIQGVKVANPQKGLYIKVEGGKATKVLIR